MPIRKKPFLQALSPAPPPRLGPAGRPPIRMVANENPLGPSPRAVAAVQAALAELHRYPDAGGVALKHALAARVQLAPESVMLGNGSDELIMLICHAMLREGDEAVLAHGSFISYVRRIQAQGAIARQIPLRDMTHDLPAMAAAITPNTRLVFVCNPNNPTGTTVGEAELRTFLDQVPDEVLVVVDEAYIEFVTRPDFPDLPPLIRAGRDNLLLLRTFAKIHGLAGLRLGYAFVPELIAYLERARPVFNVNSLAQIAGLAALDDAEHLARSLAHAAHSRTVLSEGLRAVGLTVIPGETNFVAVAVADDQGLAAALA
ncbi:histidinol-phosphate transaminase [uncultured Chloroflexus sp.]|uniref:pyridoxal phosphate-dependent aminotransferase n=1 Tax=uncultured Chloroflexus sp. TaxID=214040 RepID=UPI0026229D03|nr:histidinol-phosphate transaminase [uncultured Chloroflexus sp.]